MRSIRRPSLTALLAGLLAFSASPVRSADQAVFARSAELQPAIAFWTRVYSEADSLAGYVHDSRDLGIIYETLHFNWYDSPELQDELIEQALQRYRTALRAAADAQRDVLDPDARRVLEIWGDRASPATLTAAASTIRFQRGQADRMRDGIIRAGAWEPQILKALRDAELPEAFAALPHVESSYNPQVYSHAGAAGLWQFTRFTGRHFMRVDHVVDERLDPVTSTQAAIRLLQRYHDRLNSWPLAITAYNHGISGVLRAVRETGSRDIGVIVKQYNGPRFGFASRNFYAAFLAASDVARDAGTHFGHLKRNAPSAYWIVRLPAYVSVSALTEHLKLDADRLKALNPALQEPVWKGSKFVPENYQLRLPAATDSTTVTALLTRIERFARQVPDYLYTVRAGDTLSGIAQRHKQSVRDLMALNNFSSAHRIRAGQSLRLSVAEPPEAIRVAVMQSEREDAESVPMPASGVSGIASSMEVRP